MSLIQKRMARILHRSWWALLLRGLAAVVFGILALLFPGPVGAALLWVFGAYAFVDGVLSVGAALAGREEHEDWWLLFLAGLLGLGIGALCFLVPAAAAMALLFYIAIWAIGRGLLEVAFAVHLRKEVQGEWVLFLAGILSVFFGVALLARPAGGVLALLWLIGAYALVLGIILVVLALRARAFGKRLAGS